MAGTDTITLDGDGSETIDGGATLAISGAGAFTRVRSDGANWMVACC